MSIQNAKPSVISLPSLLCWRSSRQFIHPTIDRSFKAMGVVTDKLCLVSAIDDTTRVIVVTQSWIDVILEFLACEPSFKASPAHDSTRQGRFKCQIGVVDKIFVELFTCLSVIGSPRDHD